MDKKTTLLDKKSGTTEFLNKFSFALVMNKKKIINDPIYGFVSIENVLIFDLIEHPYFQRLRRIKQLGLTNLVYPGANHTRFHHALGAMHLITKAIKVLRSKGVEITSDEETSAQIAILLHDIGHGPFSHVMEHAFIEGISHEEISLAFMKVLNTEFNGALDMAIEIFVGNYPKNFLHQLVSSQLDVDRLDYLTRDSFYTGVSEGIIGLERIIQMLNVKNDNLVIDEKGIYSVEKFLIARRLMYWQVYLHKTTIAADCILLNALNRARQLRSEGKDLFSTPGLSYFLDNKVVGNDVTVSEQMLHRFSLIDDLDVLVCLKAWQDHDDKVLAYLSSAIIKRRLPQITIQNEEISLDYWRKTVQEVEAKFNMNSAEAEYLVMIGKLHNSAYHSSEEEIMILQKDGQLVGLTQASQNYNFVSANPVTTKYFVCSPK